MDAPLLILYGSQTGNAQDVAERVGREARLRLFIPRVLPMDSYDVTHLPSEGLIVCVASTTGQGEAPDNMRKFWRFLLRKSLPPDSLAACRYAVFGLGDSGYPNYNVVAKKLDRRLEGLGARPLLERGLGDDQHPNGYEAALDPWLPRLWRALRAACPLPQGAEEPVISEEALLELGPPKFRTTWLQPAEAAAAREALAARLQAEQPHVTGLYDCVRQHPPAVDSNQFHVDDGGGSGGGGLEAHRRLAEAVAAAADFRRLAMYVSGVEPTPEAAAITVGDRAALSYKYGPWRPYLARVAVNRRVTAADHFQDTRHIELDLGESGLSYQPGDLLALLPMTDAGVVDSFLRRLGLDGEAWVRVEAAGEGEGEGQQQQEQQQQQPGEAYGLPGDGTATAAGTRGSVRRPYVVARVRSLVQGCLDIGGASPRRYFFQVLRHFADVERERERLSYFATAEGRDDLYRYNQREGRTVLEVLNDFPSASPPLDRMLEAAPPLRPRLFSAASSQRLRGPAAAHLLVALVSYKTPLQRRKTGLCSAYLGRLSSQEGREGKEHLVAVWTETGSMRLPRSPETPLILVGPGTGVAPFRAFLEERYAVLLELQGGKGTALTQKPQPGQEPRGEQDGHGSSQPTQPPQPPLTGNRHSSQQLSRLQAGEQQQQQEHAQGPQVSGVSSNMRPAPCCLFFGCRGRETDFYYREQWEQYMREGVLDPGCGLITAFSRDPLKPAEAAAATVAAPPPPPQEARDGSPTAIATAGGGGGGGSGKVYVTHRIREYGAMLWRQLSEGGAVVFVSGSAKRMPEGVAAAFTDVAAQYGGLDPAAAAAFVRQLQLKGRYHVEAWS